MSCTIAMWSGPRNISTAMMRSWENRDDTSVIDEPFYAVYLAQSGLRHPCYEEILNSMETDYEAVVKQLTCPVNQGRIFYQKHMTHHIPRNADMTWAKSLQHCFLIRNPSAVIASYTQKMHCCSQEDIGIIRQAELYEEITALTGQEIPIIDSDDVLRDPLGIMSAVCHHLKIDFDQKMLTWPAGKRHSDGIWASHWYGAVELSTGFTAPSKRQVILSHSQQRLADAVEPFYQQLFKKRLTPHPV